MRQSSKSFDGGKFGDKDSFVTDSSVDESKLPKSTKGPDRNSIFGAKQSVIVEEKNGDNDEEESKNVQP